MSDNRDRGDGAGMAEHEGPRSWDELCAGFDNQVRQFLALMWVSGAMLAGIGLFSVLVEPLPLSLFAMVILVLVGSAAFARATAGQRDACEEFGRQEREIVATYDRLVRGETDE